MLLLPPLSETNPPAPVASYTPSPTHNTSTPSELIEALSAVVETTLEMATFSSLACLALSHYTHLSSNNFSTIYIGISGEFLQNLPLNTAKCHDRDRTHPYLPYPDLSMPIRRCQNHP